MNIYYNILRSHIIFIPSNARKIMQLMYSDKSIATFSSGNSEYSLRQYTGNEQCAALIETSVHLPDA
jgi:hypothetical protein